MEQLLLALAEERIAYIPISGTDVLIGDKKYRLLDPIFSGGKLFDEEFHLVVPPQADYEFDYYIFQFGGIWYYTPNGSEDHPSLNRVRFIGQCSDAMETSSFLGVRGCYEILNGTNLYDQWAKKAKFLGVRALGICEKNTLAGVLKFQNACLKEKIKPIIGATYTIYRPEADLRYDIKCYALNEQGWENLLLLNTEVNVVNQRFVLEDRFWELTAGLCIVLDPKSLSWADVPVKKLPKEHVYYQLDSVEYQDNTRDKEYLLNLKVYVNDAIPPIAITDAFYLNKSDAYLKSILNQLSNVYEYASNNQHFKSKEEYFYEIDTLFKGKDKGVDLFTIALNNEAQLVNDCQFQVSQSGKFLPRYVMTGEERTLYADNNDLFWSLIAQGLQEKVNPKDHARYLERVVMEVEVIELGDVIDYFLILWDIIAWSNRNGILTGIGRGSAGGSLVAYLLNITHLDPIRFGLLFERFLNRGRVEGGSLPDIDSDFAGARRDEVKAYMEQRYGVAQVCSVGTYTTLQVRAAIKDLARLHNIPPQEANWVTTVLEAEEDDVTGIFKNALRHPRVMAFVQSNVTLINDAIALLNQPKAPSIHACATIVLPKDKDIYHWIPVKKMLAKDEEMHLVSEWEGEDLESIGLLKADILGIRQLDKFQFILNLIKKNKGIDVNIYTIPYDDELVFHYFRKGWTQDVFHFGAKGLTGYCKQVQPDNIDDLIAAISLYRPGPIESNLHNKYILRKEGQEDVEYLWGTEEITADTYGILVYQEQIMQTCVVIGGFTLVEADDIRKALGKKKQYILDKYKQQFLDNAVAKGCELSVAEDVWSTMEKFAAYSFNKSHGAAYAITGYICQWLKAHYPIEFWTAAFEFADSAKKDEIIPQFISEINASGSIKLSAVDINQSYEDVRSNYELNTIYWAINSVKQVGGMATTQIIQDRDERGPYFSFDEFVSRHKFKGSKVNKGVIENLVFSGAFDKVESLTSSMERKRLLTEYYAKNKVKDENSALMVGDKVYSEWWWDLQQRRLCNLATFDYRSLCDQYLQGDFTYLEQPDFQSTFLQSRYYGTGGCIVEVIERNSKKKGRYCSIRLDSNNYFLWVTIFPDQYATLLKAGYNFVGAEGLIMLVSGMIKKDDFKKENIMKVWDESSVVLLS